MRVVAEREAKGTGGEKKKTYPSPVALHFECAHTLRVTHHLNPRKGTEKKTSLLACLQSSHRKAPVQPVPRDRKNKKPSTAGRFTPLVKEAVDETCASGFLIRTD